MLPSAGSIPGSAGLDNYFGGAQPALCKPWRKYYRWGVGSYRKADFRGTTEDHVRAAPNVPLPHGMNF